MIKIIIVEDHPLVIDGLTNVLSSHENFAVLKSCFNAKELLTALEIELPNVILMDIRLPDIDGITLCKMVKKKHPEIEIIALTTFNHRYYIQAMIESGAKGYVLKNASPEEIIESIIYVNEGVEFFTDEVKSQIKSSKKNPIYISKREREILRFIAEGFTNKEIAEKLFISHLTVDSHRKNLILKFQASNTASLIHMAHDNGYIDDVNMKQ